MSKYRSWSLILMLSVAMLILAGCPPPAPADSAADSGSGAAAGGDAAASGAAVATGGDCANTITLGAAVSETGKYAREGKDTRQGYDTWLDWVNNDYGGIKVGDECYNVDIIYYDDEGDPDTAATLVEKLITEDEVNFLLGPYSSSLTMSTSAKKIAVSVAMTNTITVVSITSRREGHATLAISERVCWIN